MTGGADSRLALVTEALAPEPRDWLAARCRTLQSHDPEAPGYAPFDEAIGAAEALVVRTYTRVSDELLDRAPNLRVVGRAGVGLDNIDLAACAERGVRVVHTPGANTRAVVELVVASMLDAMRPRARIERPIDAAAWSRMREALVAPRQLAGSTLGILGLGRIGGQVARAAAGLDMRVIYHDMRTIPVDARFGAEPVGRDELLSTSDVLSVHVDWRASNRALLGEAAMARLRDDVVLINTSRGSVIDDAALARFLRAHPGAMALLDVHDPEPVTPDSPLLGLANAHLTPHIGGATRPAKTRMSWVVRDVWRVLQGETPEFEAGPADAGA